MSIASQINQIVPLLYCRERNCGKPVVYTSNGWLNFAANNVCEKVSDQLFKGQCARCNTPFQWEHSGVLSVKFK